MNAPTQESQVRKSRRTAIRLTIVTALMFGFGYALVPLYSVICSVTGLNGKTVRIDQQQAAQLQVDKNRTVTVEFTTATANGMPWDFGPLVSKVQVHPGEPTTVEFYARNLTDKAITGQAVPSLSPNEVARYFKKTECFCFSQQHLAGREERNMPVRFIIDPALPADVHTVTLSYTFFSVKGNTAASDTKTAKPAVKQGS